MRYVYDLPMTKFFKDANLLLISHWKELANNQEVITLSPDIPKYQMLQDNKVLFNVIAYDDDEIIGYSVIFITPNLHYMQDKFAMVDLIYVKEDRRASRVGLDLIRITEDICKKEGASIMSFHTKPSHPAIEKILYRKGFKHYENIIGKLLKE